jgi:hypothetical protein
MLQDIKLLYSNVIESEQIIKWIDEEINKIWKIITRYSSV